MKARINHGMLCPTLRSQTHAPRARGFSLIELLIVVAIILIIAAIAIPQFLSAKIRANEAAAVQNLRTVSSAQVTYMSYFPTQGFADDISKLGGMPGPITPASSQILDWVLGCPSQPCPRSGYNFSIESVVGAPPSEYKAVGVPMDIGRTGNKGYCSTQSNLIMVDPNGATACTDFLK